MLRTIIVEDEPLSRMYLINLLQEAFGDVAIIAAVATEEEAVAEIARLQPDLVFTDIGLQTGSGFGVVSRITAGDTRFIFTTALDQYATNILQLAGVPYIQKPIDLDSLSRAVEAAREPYNSAGHAIALGHLRATTRNNGIPTSMLVAGEGAPVYVSLDDIIVLEAAGRESHIRLCSGEELKVPLDLSALDTLLREFGFFRAHMQYVINRRQVQGSMKEGQEFIAMQDGSRVPVSPKKADALRRFLKS